MKHIIVVLMALSFAGCGMFGGKKSVENKCTFTSAESKKVAAADVKCAVKQLRPAMKTCFEEEVGRNQAFEATQAVKFEISQDGKAQNISWEPDPGSDDLKKCASEVLEDAPFPTHKGKKAAKSRFPFKFKKVAAAAPPAEAAPAPEAAATPAAETTPAPEAVPTDGDLDIVPDKEN